MTILVIGTGAIGQRHASNLTDLGETVTSYSWRSGGLQGLNDLLDTQKFEAAIVATASDVRLPVIKATSSFDLPVYLEKPIAFRPDELAAITEILGPLGARSFAGFMMRYHPALQFLAEQDLTTLFRFDLEIGSDVHSWRKDWVFADSYAAQAEGGGVLLDLCHEIDMAVTLVPDAKLGGVTSFSHVDFPRVDFSTHLDFQTGHGAGRVSMDYLAPVLRRMTRLRTRDAIYDFDFAKNHYVIDGSEELNLSIDRQDMFKETMTDFLRLVRGDVLQNPIAPVFEDCARSNALICEAWSKRAFSGQVGET